MASVLIGMGSNLGDRQGWLRHALKRLDQDAQTRVAGVSPLFETDPVGGPAGQGAFLNACAVLATERDPADLLAFMLRIEQEAGRVRTVKDAPRTLDLDILLFGDQVIQEEGLTVPHPAMTQRCFVMTAAAEVAGDWQHPTEERSLTALAQRFVGASGIRPLAARAWWTPAQEAAR